MLPVLRLLEDVLANGASVALPARPRMMLVMHGSIAVAGRILHDDEALCGEGAVAFSAGDQGATVWRWELAAGEADNGSAGGAGVVSHQKLSAQLNTLPAGALILRGDSVAVSTRRLRLPASASGAGHSLPCRRRLPYRFRRPLDLLRAGGRLVRKRAGAGVRAGRRPANSICPRYDPAARLSRQKLGRISARGRQGQTEIADL